MRKFFLLPVFCLTVLAASCSTDDSVKMNEENSDVKLKALQCTNFGEVGGSSDFSDTQYVAVEGDDVVFHWNPTGLLRTPGITYTSRIQVRNRNCTGSTTVYNFPIDLYNHTTFTKVGGFPVPPLTIGTDNCFEYRYYVQGSDGSFIKYCSSVSPWYSFSE